jgi:hypothetical protein
MDNLVKQNAALPQPDPEPPSEQAATNVNAAPRAANLNHAPKAAPYKKSAGDKLFDLGVYGGLGYVANAAVSLVVTRYGTHLKGAPLYKLGQKAENGFASLYKPLMKDAESVDYWAKKSNEIAFLGFGGWALLMPMKWLEDRKANIIRATDETLGTGPQTPEGIQQQIQSLDNGPRQSAGSMFWGRVVSYATTIAVALPFISRWTKTGERFSLFLDKNLSANLSTALREPSKMIDGKKVPLIVDSLGSEIILAGTASVLHYVTSKGLAAVGHNLQNPPKGYPVASIPLPQLRISQPQHEERIAADQPLQGHEKA